MYNPTYTISDKLLTNIVKLEIAKATVNPVDLSYSVRTKLSLRTKGENLFHLAHMLNLSITLKDAEKLAEGRRLELESDKLRVLVNFRNILEFNRSNVAESYTDVDANVLLHLNKIMLTNWKPAWEVKIRTVGEDIDATYDDWTSFRDKEVQPEQIEAQLLEALQWFQASNHKVNNLIRTAALVYRLIELMPFMAGNKYTIMALADLLLYQFGYIGNAHVPILRNFDLHTADYWKMWDVMGTTHDLTPWLEKFAEILGHDVGDAKLKIDQLVTEETEKNSAQPFLDLNKRQLKVLRYLQNIPTVKREDYCQMMEVSTMTAFRDLNDLVRKKLLKVEGQGRGTRYTLASR